MLFSERFLSPSNHLCLHVLDDRLSFIAHVRFGSPHELRCPSPRPYCLAGATLPDSVWQSLKSDYHSRAHQSQNLYWFLQFRNGISEDQLRSARLLNLHKCHAEVKSQKRPPPMLPVVREVRWWSGAGQPQCNTYTSCVQLRTRQDYMLMTETQREAGGHKRKIMVVLRHLLQLLLSKCFNWLWNTVDVKRTYVLPHGALIPVYRPMPQSNECPKSCYMSVAHISRM